MLGLNTSLERPNRLTQSTHHTAVARPELCVQHGPGRGLHSHQAHIHRMRCSSSTARWLLHTRHQEVAAARGSARLARAAGTADARRTACGRGSSCALLTLAGAVFFPTQLAGLRQSEGRARQ